MTSQQDALALENAVTDRVALQLGREIISRISAETRIELLQRQLAHGNGRPAESIERIPELQSSGERNEV